MDPFGYKSNAENRIVFEASHDIEHRVGTEVRVAGNLAIRFSFGSGVFQIFIELAVREMAAKDQEKATQFDEVESGVRFSTALEWFPRQLNDGRSGSHQNILTRPVNGDGDD
jgi:hypothetical protein